MQADLTDPSSLPATLVGVSIVIDCATARPEESADKVDWDGKKALIQCAQAMGIQRYIFCSIHNCERFPNVPLMQIKVRTAHPACMHNPRPYTRAFFVSCDPGAATSGAGSRCSAT